MATNEQTNKQIQASHQTKCEVKNLKTAMHSNKSTFSSIPCLRYSLLAVLLVTAVIIVTLHSVTFHHVIIISDNKQDETEQQQPRTTTIKPKQRHEKGKYTSSQKKTSNINPQKSSTAFIKKEIKWNSAVYLPVPKESITAFKKYQDRQKQRLHLNLWSPIAKNSSSEKFCLSFTPECQFFREINLSILFDKCCSEHRKLKLALTYTIRAIEFCNDGHNNNKHLFDGVEDVAKVDMNDVNFVRQRQKIQLFLDSGSLLSFTRDGGDTLVPWETDIDLGVVGAWPAAIDACFKKFQSTQFGGYELDGEEDEQQQQKQKYMNKNSKIPRHHYFESCKRKKSANKSRDGTCSDAFYVYAAKTAGDASTDTSRVEIWPFREDGAVLVHPTRKKLTVPRDFVVPLTSKSCVANNKQLERRRIDGDDNYNYHYFWGINKKMNNNKKNTGDDDVLLCPHQTEKYLDNEYGPTWRWPKTIHWGENNAPSWNKKT